MLAELVPFFLALAALLAGGIVFRRRNTDPSAMLLGIALLFVGTICVVVAVVGLVSTVRVT